jgi:hypothetical protein
MKNEDVENMLNRMQIPEPEKVVQPRQLKIPLLSYRKSSKAGLWLLLLPLTFALTIVLKIELGIQSQLIESVRKFFAFIDNHVVLTYLIPLIFLGFPTVTMAMNLLAICHFQNNPETKELIITIKRRPLNIAIFLLAFALIIYFLQPDQFSF